jgi:hypothetical protein
MGPAVSTFQHKYQLSPLRRNQELIALSKSFPSGNVSAARYFVANTSPHFSASSKNWASSRYDIDVTIDHICEICQ